MQRRRPAGMAGTATIALLVVNAAVYLFQYYYLPRFSPDFPFEDHFALSLEGLRGGHFWQLLTFQFLHGGFVHLFLNSWAIFVFGRPVESALGKGRMLSLYFLSGIFGGLVQMALAWFLPETFGAPIVGASAGAFGLVAAFAVMFPDQPLLLLVAFVIPVKMRARTMLWVSVAIAVLGILAVVLKIWQSNIGHAAHLGGIAVGFALAHWFSRGYRSRPIIGLPGRIVR